MNLAWFHEKLLQVSNAGARTHRRDADRRRATRNVARRPTRAPSEGRRVDTLAGGNWPTRTRTSTGAPARRPVRRCAARRAARKRPSGAGCRCHDVDGLARARHQVVDAAAAGRRNGRGKPCAWRRALPGVSGQIAAQVPPLAVGVAAAGRQRDVGSQSLQPMAEPGEIVGLAAPAVGRLHQPVRQQPVAAREIVGDAGIGARRDRSWRARAGAVRSSGSGPDGSGASDAAVADQRAERGRRGQQAVGALALPLGDRTARQIAAARGQCRDQQQSPEFPCHDSD